MPGYAGDRRHHRKGTLWEERFKSVLVEGDEKALMTIAAYIALWKYKIDIMKVIGACAAVGLAYTLAYTLTSS